MPRTDNGRFAGQRFTPWFSTGTEDLVAARASHERAVADLVGRRIVGVRYWLIAATPDGPQLEHPFVGGDEILVVFDAESLRRIGFDGRFVT